MKWVTILLVALIATGASAIEFRLGDLGQGNPPSLMTAFDDVGFVPSFGFQKLEDDYEPVVDFSFHKRDIFGRVGIDFDGNPDLSFGVRSGINSWIGVETYYIWNYDKAEDEFRYSSDGSGRVGVGIFASF